MKEITISIGGKDFTTQSNGRQLTLSNNPFSLTETDFPNVTVIPKEIFQQVPDLKSLDLNNCYITEIPEDFFEFIPNLMMVNLNDNMIDIIHPNTFNHLNKLAGIQLSNNKLTTLPPELFKGMKRMMAVTFTANALTFLPSGIFDDTTRLVMIDVAGNKLKTLPRGIFDNLFALQKLFMKRNSFESLPRNIFDNLVQLVEFDMDYIPNVDETYFKNNKLIPLEAFPYNLRLDVHLMRKGGKPLNNLKSLLNHIGIQSKPDSFTPSQPLASTHGSADSMIRESYKGIMKDIESFSKMDLVDYIRATEKNCSELQNLKDIKVVGGGNYGDVAVAKMTTTEGEKEIIIKLITPKERLKCIQKGDSSNCNNDLFQEHVTGYVLDKAYKEGICFNFPHMLKFNYCKKNPLSVNIPDKERIYILMEKLDGELKSLFPGVNYPNNIIWDDELYFSTYIQIIMSLYVFSNLRINHNDLHAGNIMYLKKENCGKWGPNAIEGKDANNFYYYSPILSQIFPESQGYITFPAKYLVKIIDFGFSTVYPCDTCKPVAYDGNAFADLNKDTLYPLDFRKNIDYNAIAHLYTVTAEQAADLITQLTSPSEKRKYTGKLSKVVSHAIDEFSELKKQSDVIPKFNYLQLPDKFTEYYQITRKDITETVDIALMLRIVPKKYFTPPDFEKDFFLGYI